MITILIITGLYFLLGAVAVFVIAGKKPEKKKELWTKYFIYLVIVFSILLSVYFYPEAFPYFTGVLIVCGFYEISRHAKKVKPVFFSITLFVFAIISLGFFNFSLMQKEDILFLYVLIFVFDGFSQITGQLFGKHQLSRVISPAKTIEGTIGGYIFTLFTTFLVVEISWYTFFVVSLICLAALAGDLLASFYKRKAGIKDYHQLIPGHGGVLDRFDSFIFAGGFYYSLTKLSEFNRFILIDLHH